MSLADKIGDILNVAPATIDPEDDSYDDTRAKTVETVLDEAEIEEYEAPLRRRAATSLLDEDERYAGKTISRKRLADSDEDEALGSDLEQAASQTNSEDDDDDDEEEEEDDESQSDSEDGEEYEDFSEEDTTFEHMTSTDLQSEKKKGLCVKNQISIWESILEMRIQIQKCLLAANKMPQGEYYKQIEDECGSEFTDKTKEVKGTVTDLLEKFLVLQSLFVSQYPETKTLLSEKDEIKTDKALTDGDDDEEIPSEDEEEAKTANTKSYLHKAKRRKLEYYGENLENFHNKYRPYCNSVIQKWNDKTTISLSQSNKGGSVLNQIQYALSDKARLIRKTQLKRSNYEILGVENNDEYNTEIFDDDDFYHQLLRELIEFRSADLTDPVQLSRQWIQLQNLRSKMKKTVDTRATKGRKIRYAVHSKLVNFMAPMDEGLWTEEAKNDLFKSLFRGEMHKK